MVGELALTAIAMEYNMAKKQLILDALIGDVVSIGMKVAFASGNSNEKSTKATIAGITALINEGTLKVLGTYTEAQESQAVPVDLTALLKSRAIERAGGEATYTIPACEEGQYHVFTGTIFPRWVNEGPAEDSLAGMFANTGTEQKAGGLY